jgi:hypothetical protein
VSGSIVAKFAGVIVKLFKSKIVHAGLRAGEKAAKSAANDIVNKILRSFPLDTTIKNTPFFVDYSLGAAPQVRSDHIELLVDGTILDRNHKDQRPPFTPADFPGFVSTYKHV